MFNVKLYCGPHPSQADGPLWGWRIRSYLGLWSDWHPQLKVIPKQALCEGSHAHLTFSLEVWLFFKRMKKSELPRKNFMGEAEARAEEKWQEWKGYCLWEPVIPHCKGAPCDCQSQEEEREPLKKIQAEKFRHKDASLWNSTATVKYYMVRTSADPS